MTEATTLAACSTCGAQVSTAARTCPHCGQRSPTPKSVADQGTRRFVAFVVAVVLVLGGWLGTKAYVDHQNANKHKAQLECALEKDAGLSTTCDSG